MNYDVFWTIAIIFVAMWGIVALGSMAYQGDNPDPETPQPKLIPKQPYLLTEIYSALKDPAQREEFNKGSKFKCEPILGEDKWGLKSEQTPGFYIQQVGKHLSLQQIIDTPEGVNKQEAEVIVWAILKHAFSSLKLPSGKAEEKILPILLELTFEQATKDWNESVVKALETTSKVYAQEVGPTFEAETPPKRHLLDDIEAELIAVKEKFSHELHFCSNPVGIGYDVMDGKVVFHYPFHKPCTIKELLAVSDDLSFGQFLVYNMFGNNGKTAAYSVFKYTFKGLELPHLERGCLRHYGGLFERFVEEDGYTVTRALGVINNLYVKQCQKTKTLTK